MNTLYFLAARHASCQTVALDSDFVHQDISFLPTFRQPRCFYKALCNEPALRVEPRCVTQQFLAWDEVVSGQRSNQTFGFS